MLWPDGLYVSQHRKDTSSHDVHMVWCKPSPRDGVVVCVLLRLLPVHGMLHAGQAQCGPPLRSLHDRRLQTEVCKDSTRYTQWTSLICATTIKMFWLSLFQETTVLSGQNNSDGHTSGVHISNSTYSDLPPLARNELSLDKLFFQSMYSGTSIPDILGPYWNALNREVHVCYGG